LSDVLNQASVVTEDGERRWMLDPGTRSQTLATLGGRAVDVLKSVHGAVRGPISDIMSRLIRNEAPPVDEIETDQLRIAVNAAESLKEALPPASETVPRS